MVFAKYLNKPLIHQWTGGDKWPQSRNDFATNLDIPYVAPLETFK